MLYCFVILFAIIMGLTMSYSLVYVSKFKQFMSKKKHSFNNWLRIFDVMWKVMLPVAFGFIALIWPADLLCVFIEKKEMVKPLSSLYLYTFVISFFVSCYLLVKKGLIQTKP